MFVSGCSFLGVRPLLFGLGDEQPAAPPPARTPHQAWAFEEGGSTASRWTPLPRPAKENGQARPGKQERGRGRGGGHTHAGEQQTDEQEEDEEDDDRDQDDEDEDEKVKTRGDEEEVGQASSGSDGTLRRLMIATVDRRHRTPQQRRFTLAFAVLALFLALAGTVLAGPALAAPAHAATGAQDRTGAFFSAAPTCTRADPTGSPCTRPGSTVQSARFAVGCCVAARGATGAESSLSGCSFGKTCGSRRSTALAVSASSRTDDVVTTVC